jgi:1,4-dihydroxy-2-naphthoate octaprenyltransferase
LWWAVGVLLPVHMAMMLTFELPDLESDASTGKRVLGVRLGEVRTGQLIVILLAVAGIIAVVGVAVGGIGTAALWAASAGLIPALVLLAAIRKRSYSAMTLAAVSTFAVMAAILVFVVAG